MMKGLKICGVSDPGTLNYILNHNHKPTMIRAIAERTMLEILDGSCQTPIAGLAIITEDQIILKGEILTLDGSKKISYEASDSIDKAFILGKSVGLSLLKKAGLGFFSNT